MLAAEYVAGTLTGASRRRFKRLLKNDAALRTEVRYWEERFATLGVFEPVPPRDLVWTEIEQRIRQGDDKVVPIVARQQKSRINALRIWAAGATAAVVVMAVLMFRQSGIMPPVQEKPRIVEVKVQSQAYIAAIKLPEESGQWTVSILPDTRAVRVLASQPAKLGEDQDYELWWIGDNGSPTSLGLLPRKGAWQVALPSTLRLSAKGTVAVSLEQAGGSPAESGPTGPVLVATPLVPSI
tara:strand:- start:9086 stop:9802 length:717 start_codon:yes stop_codon:yes gene_type:complete